MRENTTAGVARGAGIAPCFLWARFTPVNGAAPTLTHGLGLSVARTNEGLWTVTIDPALKPAAWTPFVSYIENDTANHHQVRVDSMDESAGTFVVSHKFLAYADIDGVSAALTADDIIDQITVLVVGSYA